MKGENLLNIIQSLQKNIILNRIKRLNIDEAIEEYKKIANEEIRDSKDIKTEILNKISNERELALLPDNLQLELRDRNEEELGYDIYETKYYSDSVQKQLYADGSVSLKELSNGVQRSLYEHGNVSLRELSDGAQRSLYEHGEVLLKDISNKCQIEVLSENPKLILDVSNDVRDTVLSDRTPDSIEWETLAKNMSDEDFNKLNLEGNEGNYEEREKRRENLERLWLRSASADKFTDLAESGKLPFGRGFYLKELPINIQEIFWKNKGNFDKSADNVTYTLNGTAFSMELINKMFIEKYGNAKFAEYKELISETYKAYSSMNMAAVRFIDYMFKENSIIENIPGKEYAEYVECKDEKEKKEKFDQMVKKAYGEKAYELVSERKGLLLEDLDNAEILTPEIVDNFRPGFVHDLMSYYFKDIDSFIEIAKNPQDLKAFKNYYKNISGEIGENVVTMQACMERYREFRDLLVETSNSKLTIEEQDKINQITMWRKNLGQITTLKQLPMAEYMLKNGLIEYIKSNNLMYGRELFSDDIITKNFEGDSLIYEYPQDLLMHNSMQLYDVLKNSKVPIAGMVLEETKKIINCKEKAMKEFSENVVTNKAKIEEAYKEGRDGVQIIKENGVEIIDLGQMKVYFAAHKPSMNNSFRSTRRSNKSTRTLLGL